MSKNWYHSFKLGTEGVAPSAIIVDVSNANLNYFFPEPDISKLLMNKIVILK